jgi:hypothetical protein
VPSSAPSTDSPGWAAALPQAARISSFADDANRPSGREDGCKPWRGPTSGLLPTRTDQSEGGRSEVPTRRSQGIRSDDLGSVTLGSLLGGRDRGAEPAVTPHRAQQEEAVTRGLVNHLISRHGEWLPEEDIRRTFEECLDRFSSARIRDFVPVLAHRCANAKLRAMASDREQRAKVRTTEGLEVTVRTEVSVHDGNGQRP